MKKIRLRIDYKSDREATVVALANNGYKTWIEVEEDAVCNKTYYVVFNLTP